MDPCLGEIRLFAFNWAPEGWLLCDGRILPINDHRVVFSLLGTTYGGNGQNCFALPNLVGKEPIPGSKYCICVEGTYPVRH
jgi:microcystin-dependent protein